MFRKAYSALLAFFGFGTAVATKTFSVCTGSYAHATPVTTDGTFSTGTVDLFTCTANNEASATKVGTYSSLCTGDDDNGQNGTLMCTELWNINGCLISSVGNVDNIVARTRLNKGVLTAAPGKNCPKTSAYTGVAVNRKLNPASRPTSPQHWEKYTFTVKGAKTPLK